MPRRIVKQPNGLLAEFSTIVDSFTGYNMTPDEAASHVGTEIGRNDALAKVQRGLDDDMTGIGEPSGRGDGLDRWREAIDTVRIIHGDAEAEKWMGWLSAPYDPDEDDDDEDEREGDHDGG